MRRYVRPIQPKEAERRASSRLCRNPEDSKKVEHATTPAAKRRHRKARHVSAGKESGTTSRPGGTAHWLRHRLVLARPAASRGRVGTPRAPPASPMPENRCFADHSKMLPPPLL